MKLIKTFMATALLSTAFAGMAFAGDEQGEGEAKANSHLGSHQGSFDGDAEAHVGLGFEKDAELGDAEAHLGISGNKEQKKLQDLTLLPALVDGLLAANPDDYTDEHTKSAVTGLKVLYGKLETVAGDAEKLKAALSKKAIKAEGFKFDAKAENAGLGDDLYADLASAVKGDPFAHLVDGEVAKEIQKLHENDAVRVQYQRLLAPRTSDEVADKEAAAKALKAFLEETAAGKFQADDKMLSFAEYVKAETTPISVADHRAKLDEQAKAHKKALDMKKAAAHETAGGELINKFIKGASKFKAAETTTAFEALKLKSFTAKNLQSVDAAKLSDAILGAFEQVLGEATNNEATIADLKRQLAASGRKTVVDPLQNQQRHEQRHEQRHTANVIDPSKGQSKSSTFVTEEFTSQGPSDFEASGF